MITKYKNIEDVVYIINETNYIAKPGSLFYYDNENNIMTYSEKPDAIVLPGTYKKELALALYYEEYIDNTSLNYQELKLDNEIIKDFRIQLDVKVTEKQAYTLNIKLREFLDNYLKKL